MLPAPESPESSSSAPPLPGAVGDGEPRPIVMVTDGSNVATADGDGTVDATAVDEAVFVASGAEVAADVTGVLPVRGVEDAALVATGVACVGVAIAVGVNVAVGADRLPGGCPQTSSNVTPTGGGAL